MPDSWNRFARWPRPLARAMLALVAVMLVLAALAPVVSSEGVHSAMMSETGKAPVAAERPRDEDLKLYDNVIARLRAGQGYYEAVAIEHRASRYPLRPGFAVRLPTLATIEAVLPDAARAGAAVALLLAVILVWWRRLGEEPGAQRLRIVALTALVIGASIGTVRYFFVLHELWAGSLLVLALGLHRPERGKWLGALIAAAAAIAIREHAFPFVLLMAAFALWHRRWHEGAAWIALATVYVAALSWHLHTVAGLVRPDDPMGASWLTLRGLSGWMSMVVLSSNLRFLPGFVAGPLMILMLLGWAGWRSSAGSFATLLFLGYGLAFMIAGRVDNWYWGMTIQPAMWMGLAFAPMALTGLWRAAFPSRALAPKDGE